MLSDRIQTLKLASVPKKKFGFTRKTTNQTPLVPNISLPSAVLDSPSASSIPTALHTPSGIPQTSLALAHKSDSYLTFRDLPLCASSEALLLNDLERCFIDLSNDQDKEGDTEFSAVYLYDLKDCIVLLKPSKGSVMVHGCSNCVLVLGGHQVSEDSRKTARC